MDKLIATLICLTPLLVVLSVQPAQAEIDELDDPLWVVVPETAPPIPPGARGSEQFDGVTAIDLNGLINDGLILTFDVVNPDASYTRLQVDCNTNQLRMIRRGFFESAEIINYGEIIWSWDEPSNQLEEDIFNFVCSLEL